MMEIAQINSRLAHMDIEKQNNKCEELIVELARERVELIKLTAKKHRNGSWRNTSPCLF